MGYALLSIVAAAVTFVLGMLVTRRVEVGPLKRELRDLKQERDRLKADNQALRVTDPLLRHRGRFPAFASNASGPPMQGVYD